MEISKRMWIGLVILSALGDAIYTVAIFDGYAVLNRLFQPLRQAA